MQEMPIGAKGNANSSLVLPIMWYRIKAMPLNMLHMFRRMTISVKTSKVLDASNSNCL